MIKILKQFILVLLVTGFQVSFIPVLPGQLKAINLLLVVLIFIAMLNKFYVGVIYSFIFGVVLDIYSALPFGALTICLLITMYLVYKIYQHLITNKSMYSILGLTLAATVIYNFNIYLYTIVLYFIRTKDKLLIKQISISSLDRALWQVLFSLLLAFIFYIIFNMFSRRFKAVFIDTTKN